MYKTLGCIIFQILTVSVTSAAINRELPSPSDPRLPTESVDYLTTGTEGSMIATIDIGGIFSHNVLGSIPPNETRVVDIAADLGTAGTAYRVVGIGWDVELDAFIPSWLSDASIALGEDATFAAPSLLVSPGMGNDFGGFANFSSGGIIDLTNLPGGNDESFKLSEGVLYLEFFEVFDDFGNGPVADALWRSGSELSVQVEAVPEPTWGLAFVLWVGWVIRYRLTR